jgi:hypothetical protein
MTTTKANYGSFKARFERSSLDINNITVDDQENERYMEYMVNPLSQKELAEGWQLVIPQVTYKFRDFSDDQGNVHKKKIYLYDRFKVTLAQLPNHLWVTLKAIYDDEEYSHSVVKDGKYMYIVQPTQVDNEIKELREYITCPVYGEIRNITDTFPYVSEQIRGRMKELVNILQDNSINGWVFIRAKKILEHMRKST